MTDFPRTRPIPADLAASLARSARRLGPFARQILWYPELSSTNEVAARLADRGAREGCVVIADAQTAGRGRLGREWWSPAGAGLYVSVILKPPQHVLPLLTIAAGVALAEGIRVGCGLQTVLKWPNDVYADGPSTTLPTGPTGRKLAGILTEAGAAADGHSRVVLGFGINLKAAPFPPEVAARATSIEAALGHLVDRGAILTECLAALAERYRDLEQGRSAAVLVAWRSYAAPMMGREVEWDGRDRVERGVAKDVDETGALVVQCSYGTTRVVSGDVRWL